ncbi:phosphatase PAP2 family protein [Massilia sp. Dwa41.01b]|uniref:phosphatase PAP2 family protein n=1 Tax=unclassified Massilia TaxID=2609279 RepID=UPI0015FFFE0A|nr:MULTISPECIES: phosphatase PAP2 family protein [unclassified Massilia]QNA87451.1 phosphatase PAP2 family protein [Massilia sp. Dwa41.01b]QNA98357.1 phosphatase PAP2 family protein [Massilia sp. Se16.2.3]
MFDHLNQFLFSFINAAPGLAGWRLHGALFAAEWIVLAVPLGLVLMWTNGTAAQREAAVRALLAAIVAFTLSKVIGLMWFHPRPFMVGVGQTFLHHAPDSSFPSDHATGMFSVALALVLSSVGEARRFGYVLLGLAVVVAWARVFLGVHWPLDMAMALVVSLVGALLANGRFGLALAAMLVPLMRSIYRRVLALPIARGWIRP